MWPIKHDLITVGTRLKRTWQTPRGIARFQVREVLEVGTHLRHYEPQMDDDCCRYLITDGWQAGKEGQCARAYLASWAQEIVGQS